MALLPCGVHFNTYRGDRAYIHTRKQWVCFVLFVILLFLLPQFISMRFVAMISITAIMVIAVMGLQITSGYAGQVNLGQSAFMGMGAFVTASLAVNFDLPFWITIPAGGLGAAIFGSLFGLPALRIKGFYLALTTIAAQIIFPLFIMWLPEEWCGGAIGLQINAARLGGYVFDSDKSLYYLIMAFTVLMAYFAFNLVRTRVGRAFVAIRDNDIASEIMGINQFVYKTLAFFIGALSIIGMPPCGGFVSKWYLVLGSLQAQLIDSGVEEVHVNYAGKVTDYDVTPLTTALLKGLLTPILKDDVNFVNANVAEDLVLPVAVQR